MVDVEEPPNDGNDEVEVLLESASEEGEAAAETIEEGVGLLKSSSFDGTMVYQWLKTRYENVRLPRRYRLVMADGVLKNSIQSARFTTLCSAINTKMLNPNYPIMISEDAHPESFPSTEPFDFNSATYFLPMCSSLGVAIASIFLGEIPGRVGRKRVLLVLAWVSVVGSIVKYFTRASFWGFCITNFVFGFFLGNLPVAMAYIGDIFTSKKDKEREWGVLVSFYVNEELWRGYHCDFNVRIWFVFSILGRRGNFSNGGDWHELVYGRSGRSGVEQSRWKT